MTFRVKAAFSSPLYGQQILYLFYYDVSFMMGTVPIKFHSYVTTESDYIISNDFSV